VYLENGAIILNPLSIGYISGQALMQKATGEINNQSLITRCSIKAYFRALSDRKMNQAETQGIGTSLNLR
jgi:hypothetical protein